MLYNCDNFPYFCKKFNDVKRIELLAPARDYASAVDAVDCGADAVYIGATKFGARYAASNSLDDVARAVEYAHQFGVRVYATLNTLLFDDEIEEARVQAQQVVASGVDALIVQDMAYCRMGLDAELHASTQMCNMSPEQASFLSRCGFSRIILERALTLDDIRAIRAATDAELECFVHGAICVGHSGHCFLSRSMGERSGNRGACSQPCRLTYDLTDADRNVIIRGKHLLSVFDLSLGGRLGDLLDAGVTSFKIEGRLKERSYVRNVVSYYRRELDAAMSQREGLARASVGRSRVEFDPDPSKSFTRGGSEYFLDGKRSGVTSFDTPKAVGEYLGRVVSVVRGGFRIDGATLPEAGDGICMLSSQGVVGTNVNGCDDGVIRPNRMDGITVGAKVFRNYDNRFNRAVEHSRIRRTIDVDAVVEVSADTIVMKFTDEEGVSVEVRRSGRFDAATDVGRMNDTLRAQVSKSGDTIFSVRRVDVANGGFFVRAALLNEMRREGLEALRRRRVSMPRRHKPFVENRSVPCLKKRLAAQDNVTNRLAAEFYRDHGVTEIERGLDLRDSTAGECVMRTSYCLRREIGQCLREHPALRGDLYLEHGAHRYLLGFDCNRCEMSLTDCTKRNG